MSHRPCIRAGKHRIPIQAMFPVEDFSFVLIFLLAGGLIYFLLRIAGERLTQVTVISFLFLCLFVFSYIGIAILYFQLDEYRVWMGVDDEGKILRLFILECLALVSLLAGVIVARRPGLADAARLQDCRPEGAVEGRRAHGRAPARAQRRAHRQDHHA